MRRLSVRFGVFGVLLLAVLCPVSRAGAPPQSSARNRQTISFHFADEVNLRVLAEWVSQVTGKAFVYDETFSGTVMLEMPGEIRQDALMPLFETILKLKGFALVPREDLTLIVQREKAKQLETGMKWTSKPDGSGGEEFINRVVPLRFADAQSVANAVGHFLSSTDAVFPLPEVHQLAISDYADNVKRALEMIQRLDTRAPRPRVALLPLEHARPDQMVAQLNAAFAQGKTEGGAGPLPAPQFTADKRTNAVFVVAAEEDLPAIKETVESLDVEAKGPERPVRIYRLRNTKAEDILAILTELIQDMEQAQPAAEEGEEAEGPFGAAATTSGTGIKVVNDEKNNALVVAATREEHAWLEDLIDQLDKRRPQVLIEGWLVVLNDRGTRQLGVELAARASSGDTSGEAGTFFGLTPVEEETGRRILPPPVGQGATIAILRPEDISAILKALEEKQHGRVISRPRLLANDNEEAIFTSARQEPFTTVSAITTSTSTTSFGGYEEAGTELQITPTIYEEDYLFLDIGLSVSNFTGEARSESIPPPRETNDIETSVTVPDGATIIVGGIVQTQERKVVTKVPILGSIPLLGLLFRSAETNTVENTLYAFIRPQIFRAQDFSDLKGTSAKTERKAREISKSIPGPGE
ncbi:MAG: secretin N-terminal domain-containing protein [Candidatus Brocadiia bacterium]